MSGPRRLLMSGGVAAGGPPTSDFYGVAINASPDTYDDQTVNDRPVTAKPGAAYNPIYQAASLFGRPALRHTGANGGLLISGITPDAIHPTAAIAAGRLNSAAPNSYYSVIDRDTESGTRPWQFRINPSNKLEFVKVSGGVVTVTGATTVTRDVDHTFGWWYDGATLRIYLDGVQDGSAAMGAPAATTHSIAVGFHQFSTGTYFWQGDIGEIFLWVTSDSATIPDAHAYIAGT